MNEWTWQIKSTNNSYMYKSKESLITATNNKMSVQTGKRKLVNRVNKNEKKNNYMDTTEDKIITLRLTWLWSGLRTKYAKK